MKPMRDTRRHIDRSDCNSFNKANFGTPNLASGARKLARKRLHGVDDVCSLSFVDAEARAR
jgi:hypothetical protein